MPAKGTRKRNPKGKRSSTQMDLPSELYDALEQVGKANGIVNPRNGQGNRTRVIEKLFAQLPIFSKAKTAIQMLLSDHPNAKEYSEAVLIKLEDLEIEQAYEEAKIEGDLPDKKSGAWIA